MGAFVFLVSRVHAGFCPRNRQVVETFCEFSCANCVNGNSRRTINWLVMKYFPLLGALWIATCAMCLGEEMARPALIEAVAAGDMGAVRSLLAGGARVNAATRTGKTALIEAAERGM